MTRWPSIFNRKFLFILSATMAAGLAEPQAALACRAEIGNFVWEDADHDGIQDPGEPGIEGVVVELRASNGVVVKTVLTDSSGHYVFTSYDHAVPPFCEETWVVTVQTPSGFLTTLLNQGGDPALDSNDPAGALVTPSDTDYDGLASDLTIDFGFVKPPVCDATIGNFVWNDLNNDGIQDAGEPGLMGVAMTLTGPASVSGATGSAGLYSFANLCAGTYTVCAVAPLGFQPSPTDAGASDALDSDGAAVANNSCVSVAIAASENNATIDFGFWQKPVSGPGTGTPGYWKNTPEAWPVGAIVIGGVTYTKEQALYFMGLPDGDKTLTMFRALVSAMLNVLVGNESSCISATISAADAWMAQYGPVGSGVRARTAAWVVGEPLYRELDAYNNGDRCAPHRQ